MAGADVKQMRLIYFQAEKICLKVTVTDWKESWEDQEQEKSECSQNDTTGTVNKAKSISVYWPSAIKKTTKQSYSSSGIGLHGCYSLVTYFWVMYMRQWTGADILLAMDYLFFFSSIRLVLLIVGKVIMVSFQVKNCIRCWKNLLLY